LQASFRAPVFRATVQYGRSRSTSADRRTDEMTVTSAVPALQRYDLYDIAFLTGGPHAVVDTALVALAETGRVRASETGELHAVGLRRRSPVEAAVLDALGLRPRRSAATVRWRLEEDERICRIGARLVTDGLLTGRQRRVLTGGRPAPVRTRDGRRLVRRLRAEPPDDQVAPGTSAMLVALTGIRAMPDAELRRRIFEPPSVRRSWGNRSWGGPDGYVPGLWWAGGTGGGDIGGCGGGWGGDAGGCGDGGGGSC
jgi:hypothetical protein